MSDEPETYRARLHYDGTVDGVWIGSGLELNPLCG